MPADAVPCSSMSFRVVPCRPMLSNALPPPIPPPCALRSAPGCPQCSIPLRRSVLFTLMWLDSAVRVRIVGGISTAAAGARIAWIRQR
jgi:hypothetical protein